MWSDTMLRTMVQKVGCQLDMQKLYNASVVPACRTRLLQKALHFELLLINVMIFCSKGGDE